jgi:hypothetical protein
MSRLKPEKLEVIIKGDLTETDPIIPRRYTLTHSDATGKLTLTIGLEYDLKQISGWYTRLMRDEVLAEWIKRDCARERDQRALPISKKALRGLGSIIGGPGGI